MRDAMIKLSEGWANMAYLRTCAQIQAHGDVEEALTWAIFYLWAAEETV